MRTNVHLHRLICVHFVNHSKHSLQSIVVLQPTVAQTIFADTTVINLHFKDLMTVNVKCHLMICVRFVEYVENIPTTIAVKMFVRTGATIVTHMVFIDGNHPRQFFFGKHSQRVVNRCATQGFNFVAQALINIVHSWMRVVRQQEVHDG